MARLSVHPRLAHMLVRARALGQVLLAAQLAALLSERDLLRGGPGARDADVRARLEILRGEHAVAGSDRASLQRARRAARDLAGPQAARASPPAGDEDAGLLLAFAYPDRIGRRRAGGEPRYTLANGRGAAFTEAQPLARHELIVAVDLDDRERDARILLAAPLERGALLEHFADRIRRRESVEWSTRSRCVLARRTLELDAILLEEQPLAEVPVAAARRAMLAGVRELTASQRCRGAWSRAICRRGWNSCAPRSLPPQVRMLPGRRCPMPRSANRSRAGLRRGSRASRAASIWHGCRSPMRCARGSALGAAARARGLGADSPDAAGRLARAGRLSG